MGCWVSRHRFNVEPEFLCSVWHQTLSSLGLCINIPSGGPARTYGPSPAVGQTRTVARCTGFSLVSPGLVSMLGRPPRAGRRRGWRRGSCRGSQVPPGTWPRGAEDRRCWVRALLFPNERLRSLTGRPPGGPRQQEERPRCLPDAELCGCGPVPSRTPRALFSLFPAEPSCDVSSEILRSGDLLGVWCVSRCLVIGVGVCGFGAETTGGDAQGSHVQSGRTWRVPSPVPVDLVRRVLRFPDGLRTAR